MASIASSSRCNTSRASERFVSKPSVTTILCRRTTTASRALANSGNSSSSSVVEQSTEASKLLLKRGMWLACSRGVAMNSRTAFCAAWYCANTSLLKIT